MSHSRVHPVIANVALAVVYAMIGHATLALGETGGVELRRVIWASSGIAVTLGLLVRYPVWPGVALGGAAATWLSGSGLILIIGTGIANALEVALTVAYLRRLDFDPALSRVRDILALIFMGSGAASALGAVISVAALYISGGIPQGAIPRIAVLWWLTHAMGILVITPVGLTLARRDRWITMRHPAEIIGVLAAVALTAWLPFFSEGDGVASRLFFLPFPFLLWAAMRLGMTGAALGALIATSIAMLAAVRHSGPFAVGSPDQTLILTWLFSNVVMVATLISTATVGSMERARAAHEAGEARLRAILDGALEGIVVTDAGGTVTHVSPSIADIWPDGVPAPVLGDDFDASLRALAATLPDAAERDLLTSAPEALGRRGSIRLPDGRVWEVQLSDLRELARRRGCVWSFRDVTQRIRAEEERQHLQAQLLHGQKLESLGVMAGGIAHDFNNLLTAIRARAELIRYAPDLSEEVEEDVVGILRTSDQAAALCRQMLTYAGRGVIEVQTIDLSTSIRDIQDLLRLSVSRQVALELDLSPERLWMAADVTQLRQVALNLVTNASDAVEATGHGGTVRVTTRRSVLSRDWLSRAVIGSEHAEGEFCVLEVKDDGVGMSEETTNQIFDPFYSSKGTGRGLGLSTTLGVVRRHGGALFVESRVGSGSRFVVAFPHIAQPVDRQPVTAPNGEGDLTGRTILVVDDEADVRRIVARMLVHLGMDVLEAGDGDQALRVLSDSAGRGIDVVLLDLMMPIRSGRATLAEMRARGITTPVIIASGYSPESVEREDGVSAFVQKPFRLEDLRSAITSVLAGRAVSSRL
jgi:signal transduction histidine kinase/CheY-like chemotaxis protein